MSYISVKKSTVVYTPQGPGPDQVVLYRDCASATWFTEQERCSTINIVCFDIQYSHSFVNLVISAKLQKLVTKHVFLFSKYATFRPGYSHWVKHGKIPILQLFRATDVDLSVTSTALSSPSKSSPWTINSTFFS